MNPEAPGIPPSILRSGKVSPGNRIARAACFLTGAGTFLILVVLVVLLGNVLWNGLGGLSWSFLLGGTGESGPAGAENGMLPMIVGTALRVLLMSCFVMPAGVLSGIYLSEYAPKGSWRVRFLRGAVSNLAGVPSIVFGLFGLGFFIHFVGSGIDHWLTPGRPEPNWGKPGLIWASLTLAALTLPVVVVTTEEALRAVPRELREASLALGATPFHTLIHVVIPEAIPGILTGGILAVSRAAGEVAPLLFTGAAYYMADYPTRLTDQFMDLGYHVYVLSTQSPDIDATRPILYATVLVLLALTFSLNLFAVLARALFVDRHLLRQRAAE